MKIISGIKSLPRLPSPIICLGVFDGVHLAHRRLLQASLKKSRQIKGTSVVLTFWPHPQKKESLYSLPHRLRLIEELGVAKTIVAPFSKAFAGMSAATFVKHILVNKLNAAYVYVGENFRFGKNAAGTSRMLLQMGRKLGFKVKVFKVIKRGGHRVSSTFIRTLITAGKLHEARAMLGRPVSILGTVVKGVGLGRNLGFSTANIDPHHEITPPHGIYAVKVTLGKITRPGICYIGTKPTFKPAHKKVIEVHIFNFSRDIYGKDLEVQFIKKIREDRKFPSPLALTSQIQKDASLARAILS